MLPYIVLCKNYFFSAKCRSFFAVNYRSASSYRSCFFSIVHVGNSSSFPKNRGSKFPADFTDLAFFGTGSTAETHCFDCCSVFRSMLHQQYRRRNWSVLQRKRIKQAPETTTGLCFVSRLDYSSFGYYFETHAKLKPLSYGIFLWS